MDEDLSFEVMKQYPQLYKILLKGRLLNAKSFVLLFIKAMIQVSFIAKS